MITRAFGKKTLQIGLASVLAFGVSACDENPFSGLGGSRTEDGSDITRSAGSIKLVERDVETPEAFQETGKALWDGRPSLGGVWVASPDNTQPERVIIRNKTNGKFVIGALFKRERENPGPSLQLSSDAAEALGVVAGVPTLIDVTALRREQVNVGDGAASQQAPVSVDTTSLDPVRTDDLEKTILGSIEEPAAPVSGTGAASSLSKPFIQIGIFNVKKNATKTQSKLEANGIPSRIIEGETKGKQFWRVVAGPASSKAQRGELLNLVKAQGFSDAYFVTH